MQQALGLHDGLQGLTGEFFSDHPNGVEVEPGQDELVLNGGRLAVLLVVVPNTVPVAPKTGLVDENRLLISVLLDAVSENGQPIYHLSDAEESGRQIEEVLGSGGN